MDEKEKLEFTIKVLEGEMSAYLESDNDYDFDVNFWMHIIVSKSGYEGIIESNLDSAYSAAMKIAGQNEFN